MGSCSPCHGLARKTDALLPPTVCEYAQSPHTPGESQQQLRSARRLPQLFFESRFQMLISWNNA